MKTMINIKADREVKEEAQRLAEEMGLTLSAIINASLKQFVRSRELKFSVAPTMTPYLEKLLDEAERDRQAGKNMSGPFTAEEFKAHLKAL